MRSKPVLFSLFIGFALTCCSSPAPRTVSQSQTTPTDSPVYCDPESGVDDIHSMMIDPQGEFLSLAGPSGISVIDLMSGLEVMDFAHKDSTPWGQNAYSHILWSPDGSHLAVSRPIHISRVFVFARDDWEIVLSVGPNGTPGPAGITWSSDGEQLGIAMGHGRFLVWNRGTNEWETIRWHGNYQYGLTWPSGGPLLVLSNLVEEDFGPYDGLYNVETGDLHSLVEHWADGAYAYSVWAPDGEHVWLFFDLGGSLLDVDKNEWEGFGSFPYPKVAWSMDGRYFSSSPADTNEITVWDTTTERIVREDNQGDIIWAHAWTLEGDLLVAGCIDGRKAIWSTETGEILVLLSD